MWYAWNVNGQNFYGKVKPVCWGRNPNVAEVVGRTKKEALANLDITKMAAKG